MVTQDDSIERVKAKRKRGGDRIGFGGGTPTKKRSSSGDRGKGYLGGRNKQKGQMERYEK